MPTKISALTALTGANVAISTDLIPIVDTSATQTKNITVQELLANSLAFTPAGSGVTARTFQDKMREIVSVKDFGAVGDNSNTDTTGYQVALDSGHLDLTPLNVIGYKVGVLTVPTTIKSITGQRFYQAAAGANVLSVTSSSRLRVSDCDIYGVAGVASASSNTGIDATDCSNLQINDNYFEDFRYHAVHLKSCDHCVVSGNIGTSNVLGVRLTNSDHIQIVGNQFYAPPTPDSTFTVCIGLDTDGASPIGTCNSVQIANNLFDQWVFAQAILVHNGTDVTVSGNTLDDVLVGIHFSPTSSTDVIKRITITGNSYRGTSTIGAGTSVGNAGILVHGQASSLAEDVAIVGNTVTNANAINQLGNQGGIDVKQIKNVTISGNILAENYFAGIVIAQRANNIAITGNTIRDTVLASQKNGISIGTSGVTPPVTGIISNNTFRNLTFGIRLNNTTAVACTIAGVITTATVTLTDHGFSVGDWVRVSGVTFATAADGFYNGAFQVDTVADADTFTYTMGGSISSAAAPGSPVVKPTYDGLYIENNIFDTVTTNVSDVSSTAVVDGQRNYTAGDKTPQVYKTKRLLVTNASAVVITDLRGGTTGQIIVLQFNDGNTTIADSAPFKLTGAFTSGADDTLTLEFDGTSWCEIARAAN